MEYAASDIHRKESKRGGSTGRAYKSNSKDPKSRPKSPFERSRVHNSSKDGGFSIYSSDEEKMFVENLVELVGTSRAASSNSAIKENLLS